MTEDTTGHTNFLDLPPELRLQIYNDLFTTDLLPAILAHATTSVQTSKRSEVSTPPILHTCRLLRAEALPLCTSIVGQNFTALTKAYSAKIGGIAGIPKTAGLSNDAGAVVDQLREEKITGEAIVLSGGLLVGLCQLVGRMAGLKS